MTRRMFADIAIPTAVLSVVLIALALFHSLPTQRRGVPVRIAKNTCDCPPDSGRVMLLHVAPNAEVTINSEPVPREDLPRVLALIFKERAERIVYVSAAENVSFQSVVETIDAINNVRYTPLSLVPEPEELRVYQEFPLNIEARLVTPGAVHVTCSSDCYNWGKTGLPIVPGYSPGLR